MADSTSVALAALATTAIATVAVPSITAIATSRGQRRKFRHERFLHDTVEIRRHLDETAVVFEKLIRISSDLGTFITKVGSGPAAEIKLEELDQPLIEFESMVGRLTIRIGPDVELSSVCNELSDAIKEIRNGLSLIGALREVMARPDLEGESELEYEAHYSEVVGEVMIRSSDLAELRPRYNTAAFRLAGLVAEPAS